MRSLVDPLLARALAEARPDELVPALLVVQGNVRRALRRESGALEGPLPSELAELAQRVAGRELPPQGWVVELFPELGALYLAAPAEVVARLLRDEDVTSATVPDQGP